MDEQKLKDLFSSAVRDVPPASFNAADVEAASARIATRRRRTMITGGSLAVVAVVAVALGLGVGRLGPGVGTASSGAAGGAAVGQPAQSFGRNDLAPKSDSRNGGAAQQQAPNENVPGTPPMQGGGATGNVGPGAGGTPGGCGPTDGKLAVALANELASVGAPVKFPAGLVCPAGARSASYLVNEGGSANGYVVAILTATGQPVPTDNSIGTAKYSLSVSNGRTLTVLSVPAPGSPSAPLSAALIGIGQDMSGKV